MIEIFLIAWFLSGYVYWVWRMCWFDVKHYRWRYLKIDVYLIGLCLCLLFGPIMWNRVDY